MERPEVMCCSAPVKTVRLDYRWNFTLVAVVRYVKTASIGIQGYLGKLASVAFVLS